MKTLPAAVSLLASLYAASAEGTVRLDIVRGDGADTCADGARVQREVIRRLGQDPFAHDPERFIEAVLSRGDREWSARVRIRDAAGALLGVRSLTSDAPTCEALTEALALSLALVIDPAAATPPPPPPPAPPAPPPAVAAAACPPRAPQHAARRGVVVVGLRAVGSWGVVPEASPGAALRAEVSLSRRWRARIEGRWLSEASTGPNAGWRIGVTSAHAGLCVAPALGRSLSFDVCAGLGVGAMRVSVDGAASMHTGDHPWAVVEAGPRLRWRPWSWIELDVDASAGAALVRRGFGVVGEAAPRFDPGVLSVNLGLGVAVALP